MMKHKLLNFTGSLCTETQRRVMSFGKVKERRIDPEHRERKREFSVARCTGGSPRKGVLDDGVMIVRRIRGNDCRQESRPEAAIAHTGR